MTKLFKIALLSLSIFAGATAVAHAHGSSSNLNDAEKFFEEQALIGG